MIDLPGYQVLEELGRGGMGVVFKARQIALDRVVAVKLILAGELAGSAAVARFRREAEAAARLDHPNIVRVHDCGEVGGRPYLVMEYLDGGSLAGTAGPVDPPRAVGLVTALAAAVEHAHGRGVVHRDLKPANVLLSSGGEPKVTDFGLARRLDAADGLTASGAVMGTPSYMAPEQADGDTKRAGPPADVWALGVILYELLSGVRPFRAAGVATLLDLIRYTTPPAPATVATGVPHGPSELCMRCLAKRPADRPAAGELAAALRLLAGGGSDRPLGTRSGEGTPRDHWWRL